MTHIYNYALRPISHIPSSCAWNWSYWCWSWWIMLILCLSKRDVGCFSFPLSFLSGSQQTLMFWHALTQKVFLCPLIIPTLWSRSGVMSILLNSAYMLFLFVWFFFFLQRCWFSVIFRYFWPNPFSTDPFPVFCFLYFLLFRLSLSELSGPLFLCSFSVRQHAHVDFQLFSQNSSGIPIFKSCLTLGGASIVNVKEADTQKI